MAAPVAASPLVEAPIPPASVIEDGNTTTAHIIGLASVFESEHPVPEDKPYLRRAGSLDLKWETDIPDDGYAELHVSGSGCFRREEMVDGSFYMQLPSDPRALRWLEAMFGRLATMVEQDLEARKGKG